MWNVCSFSTSPHLLGDLSTTVGSLSISMLTNFGPPKTLLESSGTLWVSQTVPGVLRVTPREDVLVRAPRGMLDTVEGRDLEVG